MDYKTKMSPEKTETSEPVLINREEIFRRSGLFAWLPEEHIAGLAGQSELRHYREGESVFERGSSSDGVYIIAEGEITFISGHEENPEEQSASTLETGDCFGELSLIEPQVRQAQARAALPAQICFLSLNGLKGFSKQHPESHAILMTNLARQLAAKIRRLNTEKSLRTPVP